jgi:hypothetical protein
MPTNVTAIPYDNTGEASAGYPGAVYTPKIFYDRDPVGNGLYDIVEEFTVPAPDGSGRCRIELSFQPANQQAFAVVCDSDPLTPVTYGDPLGADDCGVSWLVPIVEVNTAREGETGAVTYKAWGSVITARFLNILQAEVAAAQSAIDTHTYPATDIGTGNVNNTEFGYLDGVTSAIQAQIDGKAPTAHNHAAADITSGTLPVARGGTGLSSLGTAGQVLKVNAGATALEYAAESGGGGHTQNTDTGTTQTIFVLNSGGTQGNLRAGNSTGAVLTLNDNTGTGNAALATDSGMIEINAGEGTENIEIISANFNVTVAGGVQETGVRRAVREIEGNGSVTANDWFIMLVEDGNANTITLPAANTVSGLEIWFQITNEVGGSYELDAGGSGGIIALLQNEGTTYQCVADGLNNFWRILFYKDI